MNPVTVHRSMVAFVSAQTTLPCFKRDLGLVMNHSQLKVRIHQHLFSAELTRCHISVRIRFSDVFVLTAYTFFTTKVLLVASYARICWHCCLCLYRQSLHSIVKLYLVLIEKSVDFRLFSKYLAEPFVRLLMMRSTFQVLF